MLDLDTLRCKVRVSASAANKQSYEASLAKAKTKVLATHGNLKKNLNDWELAFVKQRGREPWGDDLRGNLKKCTRSSKH